MTSDQFEELKAIQDAYLEMANKRQEEVVEEQLEEAVDNRFSKAEKEKEIAADHKGEEEPAYRSKSPKRSGFSALDRLKAKQGIKEEEVVESERSEKYKTIVSSLDRMRAKATANAELQKLQKQNKEHKKLPEDVEEEIEELDEKSDQAKQNKTQKNNMDASRGAKWKLDNNATGDTVRNWDGKHPSRQSQNKAIGRALRQEEVESLEEEKIPVNHAHDAVGSVLGQSAAVKFATNLKAGTAKHTTWKDINKTLVTQGEQTHHIAKIAAKLKPAQYNEEVEELDEMNVGKKQPRPDTHHIVDKENKPLSLAAYYDKAKAEKDRDEKHPGAKVITRGPRGKVKEEVELDEKELTDTDVKQKEKVVKGMKKNIQSFKDKYGERAKGVMYAVATNIAKKQPD